MCTLLSRDPGYAPPAVTPPPPLRLVRLVRLERLPLRLGFDLLDDRMLATAALLLIARRLTNLQAWAMWVGANTVGGGEELGGVG